MIDPATDVDGETVDAYCRRRWGGAGWTVGLKQQGRKDGAAFRNWKWWPHTLKAHQLVLYCENNGLSTDRCNALLFDAEYEQGKNLSRIDVLMDVAESMGIDRLDRLRQYLANDAGAAQVQNEIRTGRQKYGITGVPFFVVGNDDPSQRPYGFSGAQGVDTFLDLFEELSSQTKT